MRYPDERRPKREVLVDFADSERATTASPAGPLQALMECAPGDEPAESVLELQPLREAVAKCVGRLTAEQQYIVNAVASERLSIRNLAARLGLQKTQTHRLWQAALVDLERHCRNTPIIRERMGMTTYWNQHAYEAVCAVDDVVEPAAWGDWIRRLDRFVTWAIDDHWSDDPHGVVNNMSDAGRIAVARLTELGEWDPQKMADLLVWKQSKYGHGNILAFGMLGVLVRMSDKLARIKNLGGKDDGDMRDESMLDTLRDVVGYAAIANMLADDTFESELEPF